MNPYHVDSLLQLSEVCRMQEDQEMARDLVGENWEQGTNVLIMTTCLPGDRSAGATGQCWETNIGLLLLRRYQLEALPGPPMSGTESLASDPKTAVQLAHPLAWSPGLLQENYCSKS